MAVSSAQWEPPAPRRIQSKRRLSAQHAARHHRAAHSPDVAYAILQATRRVDRGSEGSLLARPTAKTAFVFTGGGSLGAIQVGMLRALLACGVQPDFVVGASVGAINASYFAGAPNLDGVAMLER